jgi:O-antigen ligase/GR25 family glycosyltransferase involved in LPS biosynthesis
LQAVPTALAGLAWRVLASHIQLSDDRLHAPVNAQVDAVFVLSVRSFHDRIAHIEAELQRHGIAFEWIFEHDAAELTPDLIEATFAPSDMGPPQQSLVLKHIETWKRCVARGYRRILVFEDDAMLASDFTQVFGAAMQAADVIEQPYMIYLGCGDNKYVSSSQSSGSVLVKTNLALPATDAIVVDQRAARLRLEYAGRQKITRPADWLMREADAAMGIAQYWLAEPIVEQGSMTGRFTSVLDRKRLGRSRAWIALRFRWDRWRRRTLKRNRGDELVNDALLTAAQLPRDRRALAIARIAAALVAIGAFTGAAVANIAAVVMLLAFFAAPSSLSRLRRAWHQPLGRGAIVFLIVLLLAATWSAAPFPLALKAWTGWRHFLLLFIALAIFDTRSSKLLFAWIFVIAASIAAVASFLQFDFGAAQVTSDVAGGIILRNHVTQGMALTAGALLALVLLVHARRGSWQQWACGAAAALMVANVVFVAYARSAYLALAVTSLVATLGIARQRARIAAVGALIVVMCGAIWLSPLISQRIERGLQEIRETNTSAVITPMGIRPVMWEISALIVRDAPLIGHGLGSFPEQYRRVVTQRYTGWKATLTADPHNQYLMILAEAGLLGLVSFAWFLFSALRQRVRGAFGVIGIALLLAWSLTSLFSSHFHTFNEGHLIAMLLGVCLARERVVQDQPLRAASTAERTSA